MRLTMSGSDRPVASIVIVVDYKAGQGEAWHELSQTLVGLAGQSYQESVEFLLIEPCDGTAVPDDVLQLLPAVRIVRTAGTTSYDFKNAGAEAATADFIVLIDADCRPRPGWWRSVIEHHRRHPQAAAISGKTVYRAEGLLPRILALIDRSYVASGGPGRTHAISNNNAGFLRHVLLQHPLRNDLGPFGSKAHAEAILADGGELRFEPGMVVEHRYGGWTMLRHDRRQIGFAMARYRQLDRDSHHAWMFGLGLLGLPVVLAMSIAGTWKKCFRHASLYGIKWFEVPVALALAIPAHAMELPGIIAALRGGALADSAYR